MSRRFVSTSVVENVLFGWRAYGIRLPTSVQTTAKAIDFYNDKVKGLETNLQDLEKIVQGKSTQLRVVEDGKYLIFFLLSLVTLISTNVSSSLEAKGSQRRSCRCSYCCGWSWMRSRDAHHYLD